MLGTGPSSGSEQAGFFLTRLGGAVCPDLQNELRLLCRCESLPPHLQAPWPWRLFLGLRFLIWKGTQREGGGVSRAAWFCRGPGSLIFLVPQMFCPFGACQGVAPSGPKLPGDDGWGWPPQSCRRGHISGGPWMVG